MLHYYQQVTWYDSLSMLYCSDNMSPSLLAKTKVILQFLLNLDIWAVVCHVSDSEGDLKTG